MMVCKVAEVAIFCELQAGLDSSPSQDKMRPDKKSSPHHRRALEGPSIPTTSV